MLRYFLALALIPLVFSAAPPYGALQVRGRQITDSTGKAVQLRGLSLMVSVYTPKYWTASTVNKIKCAWNSNVVRAAVAVTQQGSVPIRYGWIKDPNDTYTLLKTVVDAAIAEGMYVIIDWHIISDTYNLDAAKDFFGNVSQTWGHYPNIIYEIWNEATGANTWASMKSQQMQVIDVIRSNDPDNLILVGSPRWSSKVDDVAANPILNQTNIAYSFHFYAATSTHQAYYRSVALGALNKNIPLFMDEYGTVDYAGNGSPNVAESNAWWNFMDQYKLSYVNWVVNAEFNGAGIVVNGTAINQIDDPTKWSASGKLVNQKYKSTNQGVSCPTTG